MASRDDNKIRNHSDRLRVLWNEYNPNNLVNKYDGFHIHHIDGDPTDNRKENLQKLTSREHRHAHQPLIHDEQFLFVLSPDLKQMLAEKAKASGCSQSEFIRRGIENDDLDKLILMSDIPQPKKGKK